MTADSPGQQQIELLQLKYIANIEIRDDKSHHQDRLILLITRLFSIFLFFVFFGSL